MNAHPLCGSYRNGKAMLRACLAIVLCCISLGLASAQTTQTVGNQFIVAHVLAGDGTIQVQLPPGRITDGILNFYDKSFFTARIGNTYFSNNNVLSPWPSTAQHLVNPDTLNIIGVDTIHCVWANRNGVDIIQDAWPVAFTRSGQIVIRWSFRLQDTSVAVTVGCQWLNDLDIFDPSDNRTYQPSGSNQKYTNATDGPWVLTNFWYNDKWKQYPDAQNTTVPWFYMGFLFPLPGPAGGPGLAGTGLLYYPPLVPDIPPVSRLTVGDWYTLAQTIWGANPAWQSLMGTSLGPDDAVLMEFTPTGLGGKNRVVVAGQTSYGTDEFLRCIGNMFGLVFFPERIAWDNTNQKYTPSPFKVDLIAVNYDQVNLANKTQFSLTAGANLQLCTSTGILTGAPPGYAQVLPPAPSTGDILSPGQVNEYIWYEEVSPPRYFCKNDTMSWIKIYGQTQSIQEPIYNDQYSAGIDTCEHPILIGCAEADFNPPLFDDSLHSVYGIDDSVSVHDDRSTDRGLDTIYWKLDKNTPAIPNGQNFTVSLLDTIAPCSRPYGDKQHHQIVIHQIDSTLGGCYDFTFVDCMGNTSYDTVCIPGHPKIVTPDTNPPKFVITSDTASQSIPGYPCSRLFDTLLVSDNRLYDLGLDSIVVISANNMVGSVPKFAKGTAIVSGITVGVTNHLLDGDICFRAVDVAHNVSEFCIHYCTLPDTLCPIVVIDTDAVHKWLFHVCVYDGRYWDRGLGTISLTNSVNLGAPSPALSGASGVDTFCFDIQAADTTKDVSFCVKAADAAGNSCGNPCAGAGVDTDALAPNIYFSPDPKTSPTTLNVLINDKHLIPNPAPPPDSIPYVFDTGLDSVWFTDNTGILTPPPFSVKCIKSDTGAYFSMSVIDSLSLSTLACVTVHAKDCQGNQDSVTWCYPAIPDTVPPFLFVQYLDKQNIRIHATDSLVYDRGLQQLTIAPSFNVSPENEMLSRVDTATRFVNRPLLGVSSTGLVTATDYWGSATHVLVGHQASAPIQVWIQDLAIASKETQSNTTIFVPVYLVHNDTIPVASKGINAFKFQFTQLGDTNSATLTGIQTAATATSPATAAVGWNITWTPQIPGTSWLITGTAPAGTVLTKGTNDTVLYLVFSTKPDQLPRDVILQIDSIAVPTGTETIVYNNFADTVFRSTNAISTMPPPWGNISGAVIAVVGSCSPALQSPGVGTKVSKVWLDLPLPNPIARTTTLHYSIPNDGTVMVNVFDMLGREVRTLFNGTQKSGLYDLQFDATDLPNGQYGIRLETADGVVMQKITVQH